MSKVLRQNDRAWGKIKLGMQPASSTIGKSGCLLTAYCQALQDWGGNLTPPQIQDLAISRANERRPPFIGSNMIQPIFAPLVGVKAGEVVRAPEPKSAIFDAAVKALKGKGRAILGVTHDADGYVDHFVLGRRIEGESLVYADPATGEEGSINLTTFKGESTWGEEKKQYELLSVRPISAV